MTNAERTTNGFVVLRRERCNSFSHADEKTYEITALSSDDIKKAASALAGQLQRKKKV